MSDLLPTSDALRAAYLGQDVGKVRSPGALTLSMVGGCRRRAGYLLARQPVEFVVHEGRAAAHGTAIHDWLLPRLAANLEPVGEGATFSASVERSVTWTLPARALHGRLDAYVSPRLIDLKTVGEFGLNRVRRFGARDAHAAQLGGYAHGLEQEGEAVEELEVVYLDRANGDHEVVPVDVGYAKDLAERWVDEVTRAVVPDNLPRDEQGPGLSIVCDGCEFIRACWGSDAVRGKVGGQEVLAPDEETRSMALRGYADAAAEEKDAKSRKDFARAVLEGAPAGDYPLAGHRLSWRRGWAPRPVDDGKAAAARLRELGEEVPQKMDEGRRSSIAVKPLPGVAAQAIEPEQLTPFGVLRAVPDPD